MKSLPAIRPSAAIEADYTKRLTRAARDMQDSIMRWLPGAYADAPTIAHDEPFVRTVQAALRRLTQRWTRNFDGLAPKLAEHFSKAASDRVDSQLKAMLRDAGFTVKFTMSDAQRTAYQAVIGENVGLIKSIATKHLANVETLVMKSVQVGGDLGTLTKALEKNYGVTRRRAVLIAKTQNNMATAVLARTRQLQAGITKAKWLHSAGGNVPRPSHVDFSGKAYDIASGVELDPKDGIVWPGSAINCRCVSIPIINALL